MTHRDQAAAVAEAVRMVDATLPVLGMTGSVFFQQATDLGLRTVAEAFADRAYRSDGQLVSRREHGAVLADAAAIAQRAVSMVASGKVTAVDGTQVPITMESICVHGDSPGAMQIATAVRDRLTAAGNEIRAFC
ncbi:lamB/YcsF family protein [Mycobacterium ulcerans str. Harvey]|uniref:LamB/YcsF family protein n=1 Tax=Mycobacterium ulcerans str. Harvey TaxID=1299332 RepID=A0ABN0QQH1_MYCUL|nr:lamB/YcsF family protein [Mycobacterium ulcerans str. Harvey]